MRSITADPQAGLAGGWFIDEKRLFSLSLGRGEVIIAGRTRRFDKALVHVVDGDIYIDVRLLSQWFPIDIAFHSQRTFCEMEVPAVVSAEDGSPMPFGKVGGLSVESFRVI